MLPRCVCQSGSRYTVTGLESWLDITAAILLFQLSKKTISAGAEECPWGLKSRLAKESLQISVSGLEFGTLTHSSKPLSEITTSTFRCVDHDDLE